MLKYNAILISLLFLGSAILVQAAIEEEARQWKRKGLAFLEELLNHFIMKFQEGQSAVGRWLEMVVPTF